jgi:chromosome segregation ATPase
MVSNFALLAAAAIALAPMAAQAQNYRCTGKDGKKYYGSVVPPQCAGQPVEQLNTQGTVIRRFDPEGDEKQRLLKEAEAEKKRQEDAVAKEGSRRNRALLATYTTERDIDEARARALVDNQKQIKDIEGRIAALKKRQADFDKEMEFYQEAPSAKDKKGKSSTSAPAKPPKIPPKLAEDMKNAEIDLKAQDSLLEAKKKDVDNINAKYDEDKKRFIELTGKK